MLYREDWPEAAERWASLWAGRHHGRPVMVLTAPRRAGTGGTQVPPIPGPEGFWLDPAYVVPRALRQLETTSWLGESCPSYLFMGGWVTMAHGVTPHFPKSMETIWFEPAPQDLERAPAFQLDRADPWFRKFERLHEAALHAAGKDRFVLGSIPHLPGNDMLSMLMGTDTFLLNLKENPEWMLQAILQLGRSWVEIAEHFSRRSAKSHEYWYGVAGWAPFWGPEPFLSWQSDVSCMISPAMYEQFILPEMDLVGQVFGRVWYHLDGPNAIRHLPMICSREYVRVVQYVPGAGCAPNGPAYLDLYRKIQDAGRIVHIALPPNQVEPVIRELDPGLLCLQVRCQSEAEGRQLLSAAERWTASAPATGRSGSIHCPREDLACPLS